MTAPLVKLGSDQNVALFQLTFNELRTQGLTTEILKRISQQDIALKKSALEACILWLKSGDISQISSIVDAEVLDTLSNLCREVGMDLRYALLSSMNPYMQQRYDSLKWLVSLIPIDMIIVRSELLGSMRSYPETSFLIEMLVGNTLTEARLRTQTILGELYAMRLDSNLHQKYLRIILALFHDYPEEGVIKSCLDAFEAESNRLGRLAKEGTGLLNMHDTGVPEC